MKLDAYYLIEMLLNQSLFEAYLRTLPESVATRKLDKLVEVIYE